MTTMSPPIYGQTEDWLKLIRAEYMEMPGLRLTEPQARRLWGLDAAACHRLLEALTAQGFLHRTRDGHYLRFDCAPSAR
jgi:hypothetical protein